MPNTTTNAPSSDVVGFSSNDYHILPVTEKQLQFARAISERTGQPLSESVQQDRQALSAWISENKEAPSDGGFGNYASSKQVAFAERIARLKHRTVPNCSIPDDHIDPRRSAFFMARSVLSDIREGVQC
jgi:hypothetical protein